jgi:outer membrane protein assembly factor BamB
MKQPKIVILIVIVLLPLILASCAPWGSQSAGGWAGTAVDKGTVYAGTLDGRVVAVNSSTGNLEWSYSIAPITAPSSGLSCGQTSVPTAIYSTPVVDKDLVYISTYRGQVYALTIARGADRWVYPRTGSIGAIVGSPVIANETIYISSSDSMVYALDTIHGDLKWKSEILDEEGKRHEKLWTSLVVHDGAVYMSTFDGHIYALSAETGELDWSFESEAGFASSPAIYEDTIFLGSFDRYLYGVEIGSDMPIWKFPEEEPAGNWFWASPVISEGIVYTGCLDGLVYAIEAKTGEAIWEFDAESPIVSSPVFMDNLLIVAAESGNVYVINPETGDGERIKNPDNGDKPTINAKIRASFCAYQGLVYIRAEDNWIYGIDIEAGGVIWSLNLAVEE